MRPWCAGCAGLVIAAACTGGADADRRAAWGPAGPAGDVTVIVDLDGNETHDAIAVDDADGVRTITEDAIGTLTFAVHPPAAVSLLITGSSSVSSVVGVEPGDTICFPCPAQPTDVAHTVSLAAPYAGATTYSFGDGVEDLFGTTDTQVQLYTEDDGPDDVLVFANDANGPIAWTAAPSATLGDTPLVVPDDWQPLDTITIGYDDLPAGTVEAHLYYAEMSAAVARPTYARLPTVVPLTGPSDSVAMPRAHLGGPTMAVTTQLWADGIEQVNQARVDVPTAPMVHIDLATTILPWVTHVAYDEGARAASWQLSGGSPAPADGVNATLEWTTPDGITNDWFVIAPPGTTGFAFPEVPHGGPNGAIQGLRVELDDFDGVDGFAAMRSSRHRTEAAKMRLSTGATGNGS